MMRFTSVLFVTLGMAAAAFAQQDAPPPPQQRDVAVTVYSSADPAGFDPQRFIAQQRMGYDPNFVWEVPGFAVVKEVRPLQLDAGLNTVSFTDVAQFIDPTTVSFTDLADAQTQVIEQQFRFDLVSPAKLLERYIDREITVFARRGDEVEEVTGILLSSVQGQLTLRTPQGIRIVRSEEARLPELPGGLITRPTLQWLIGTNQAGERPVRTTYQTAGLTWKADYNLIVNADDTRADLVAWVTLLNLSGATYENAQLKLIAGDVQRIEPQPPMRPMMRRQTMEMAAADVGFEEQPFFEYHLYTLPRRTTIAQNTTQQITLFPTARDVPIEKVLVYYGLPHAANWGFFPQPQTDRHFGGESQKKVDVYLRTHNREENNLGMPLPRGKVRVYKQDPRDETLEFVGEDLIDHTARNEEVLIKLGQSFDVVGERTQTDFKVDVRGRVMEETFRIQIRNQKQDQAERVVIKENLYRWSNWEIVNASHEFKKIDSRTIHFEVQVPPEGEQTVTYTVRYSW